MNYRNLSESQPAIRAACGVRKNINKTIASYSRALALFLSVVCPIYGATTHRVHAGQTGPAIQEVIREASAGDTISFDAGVYNLLSALTLKCGLTYTGPVATPATAELTTNSVNMSLTALLGGCTSGTTTLQYLHFNGAGPLYVDARGYSNVVFMHNQVTGLPAEEACGAPCESMFFDGDNENSDSNITIEYNTFGDITSCTSGLSVQDGSCAGAAFNLVGYLSNLTVRYNTFYHLLEGIHLLQVAYVPPPNDATDSICYNCDIEYNFFHDITRIALENQSSVFGKPTIMSNNVFGNPNTGLTWSGMALSAPCCLTGRKQNVTTTAIPSDYIQNNVIFNSLGSPSTATPIAIEMSGAGTQATNNLVQGYFCTGVAWSYNSNNWAISYNTFQGPMMSSRAQCYGFGPSGYLGSECNNCTPGPVTKGNKEDAHATAIPSVAPSISPASGAYGFPLLVTLSDPGYTDMTQPYPQGNTGIWYTIDGSAPVPGTGTAQYIPSGGTISLSGPAALQAVGMWGTPPQPTSYPVGYGFVPSAVRTAQYTGGVIGPQKPRR
jgi:hypothetical protein